MLITKVKFVNGGDNGLQLSIIRPELKNRNYSSGEGHPAPVHVDLKAAMKSLAIHFGLLSDYIKLNQVKKIDGYDAKLIEDFIVTGFSVKGDDADKGKDIKEIAAKRNERIDKRITQLQGKKKELSKPAAKKEAKPASKKTIKKAAVKNAAKKGKGVKALLG